MLECNAINEMNNAGLIVDSISFGRIVRVRTLENSAAKNGWYKMFLVGNQVNGVFGDFSRSSGNNYSGIIKKIGNFYHADSIIEDINKSNKKRKIKDNIDAKNAAIKANRDWDKCDKLGDNSYIKKKGIVAFGNVRQGKKNTLVIPMSRFSEGIVGLQIIYPEKGIWGNDSPDKRYYPKGINKKGAFFEFPFSMKQTDTILVCEGYSTACSLYEAVLMPVYVAFDAGNLINVAKSLRERYHYSKIIICADDDHTNKINTGIVSAISCSKNIENCKWIAPCFPFREKDDKSKTDFNDLHRVCGIDEVERQIKRAL